MAIDDTVGSVLGPEPTRPAVDLAAVAERAPVREGEDAWTEAEVRQVSDELVAEIARLREELAEADALLVSLLRNSGDGAGDDQADSGSSALEREQELTLVNNTRDLLTQNRHALQRIGSAEFGVCESCGEAIGKARQLAFPRATLCVTCKARQERR